MPHAHRTNIYIWHLFIGIIQRITEHFRLAAEFYGDERAGRVMRKHCIRYASLHPSPKKVRRAFAEDVKTPADWQRVFDQFYDPKTDYPVIPDGDVDLVAAGAEC